MPEPRLRIIGTSVTLTEELCARAKADLPFAIDFDVSITDGEGLRLRERFL